MGRFDKLVEKTKGDIRDEYSNLKDLVDNKQGSLYKDRISPSMYSKFTRCKKQWELHYKDKNYEPEDSPDTMFGHIVHRVLEKYLRNKYSGDNSFELEEVLKEEIKVEKEAVKSRFEEDAHEDRHLPYDESTLKSIYEDAKNVFQEFFDFEDILFKDYFELLATEREVEGTFSNGLKFYGIIDVILYDPRKEKIYIVDTKTSEDGWETYKANDKSTKTQILGYKLYLSKILGKDVSLEDISIAFLILNRKGNGRNKDFDYIETVSVPSEKSDIRWAVKNLKDFVDEIVDSSGYFLDKNYEKEPSKKICEYCPYSTQFNGSGQCDQDGVRFEE